MGARLLRARKSITPMERSDESRESPFHTE